MLTVKSHITHSPQEAFVDGLKGESLFDDVFIVYADGPKLNQLPQMVKGRYDGRYGIYSLLYVVCYNFRSIGTYYGRYIIM